MVTWTTETVLAHDLAFRAWLEENDIGVWSPSRSRPPESSPLTNMPVHATNTGQLSRTRDHALLYDPAADAFRSKESVLDWFATITQVASREGTTVCSPMEMHDDRADNNVLAAGRCQRNPPWHLVPPQDLPAFGSASRARWWERAHWLGEGNGQVAGGRGRGHHLLALQHQWQGPALQPGGGYFSRQGHGAGLVRGDHADCQQGRFDGAGVGRNADDRVDNNVLAAGRCQRNSFCP